MRCTLLKRLALPLLLLISLGHGVNAHAQVATVDWTLAETLLAIDAPVSSIAQQADYRSWVGEPEIPAAVADIGLRGQPNLERLADSAPERILISPMFAGLAPRLERIAPVTSIAFYSADADTWQELQAITRQLGELTDREAQAAALIDETQQTMTTLRGDIADPGPLLMVQFMDARHVRVFGEQSLYNAVLEQLDLTNAWEASTNAWGFALTGIEALARYPDATLVVVEPIPTGAAEELARSGLWHQLPSVKHNRLLYLPPAWSFGALPSAQRFAHLLAEGLADPRRTPSQ